MTWSKIRDVAVILSGDGFFETVVASEVFGVDRTDDRIPRRDYAICGVTKRAVAGIGGVRLIPEFGLERTYSADLVIVPGTNIEEPPSRKVIEALRAAKDRGAYVASFCTGAFTLAHAGLLDDCLATTHHRHADRFRALFPHIRLDPDVLYVVNDNGVLCSAGTAAAIDLSLELVRRIDGPEVAATIARRMVVPPQRDGGQAQFVQRPIAISCSDQDLARLLDDVTGHLDEPHSVESMAAAVAMSPRSFARKFAEHTGTTPYRWLLGQRVRHAQYLLEVSGDSVEEIASRSGFRDAATLRAHFAKVVQTSPTSYRRAFAKR